MNRRDTVIALLALGVAPLATRAQQPDQVRRIAVLIGYPENDREGQIRLLAFTERLVALGWTEGRNVRFDIRWGGNDANRASAHAKELVGLKPDVILSNTTPATAAVQRATRTIPTVFTVVADPVGSGFVKTLSRPGGNVTGFRYFEASLVEKWLELLKEVAPRVTRVAVMFNPQTAPYVEYYLRPSEAAAPKLGVTTFTAKVRSDAEIEEAIAALGREASGGLLVMVDSFMLAHRKAIVASTARHKVPTIYYTTPFVEEGGLISYGVDAIDQFRRSADYVDRILRGGKPEDLPVQQPTKFELALNLKTARDIGVKIPQSILLRADKVIE